MAISAVFCIIPLHEITVDPRHFILPPNGLQDVLLIESCFSGDIGKGIPRNIHNSLNQQTTIVQRNLKNDDIVQGRSCYPVSPKTNPQQIIRLQGWLNGHLFYAIDVKTKPRHTINP